MKASTWRIEAAASAEPGQRDWDLKGYPALEKRLQALNPTARISGGQRHNHITAEVTADGATTAWVEFITILNRAAGVDFPRWPLTQVQVTAQNSPSSLSCPKCLVTP